MIVHKKVYKKFVERFVERVKTLRVGNGLNAKTDVGPVINQDAVEKILGYIENQPDPQACADGLVQLALESGSRDNVSCIVIDVV